jgi:hypothetical protein
MKLRTKLVFALSIALFAFFLFGVSERGQELLRGRIPENASHMEVDDIYMGAGLAPWVFGLVPSLFTGILGGAFLRADLRAKNRGSN